MILKSPELPTHLAGPRGGAGNPSAAAVPITPQTLCPGAPPSWARLGTSQGPDSLPWRSAPSPRCKASYSHQLTWLRTHLWGVGALTWLRGPVQDPNLPCPDTHPLAPLLGGRYGIWCLNNGGHRGPPPPCAPVLPAGTGAVSEREAQSGQDADACWPQAASVPRMPRLAPGQHGGTPGPLRPGGGSCGVLVHQARPPLSFRPLALPSTHTPRPTLALPRLLPPKAQGPSAPGQLLAPSPVCTPLPSPGPAESWTLRHSQGLFSAACPPGPPACSEVLPQSGSAGPIRGRSLALRQERGWGAAPSQEDSAPDHLGLTRAT